MTICSLLLFAFCSCLPVFDPHALSPPDTWRETERRQLVRFGCDFVLLSSSCVVLHSLCSILQFTLFVVPITFFLLDCPLLGTVTFSQALSQDPSYSLNLREYFSVKMKQLKDLVGDQVWLSVSTSFRHHSLPVLSVFIYSHCFCCCLLA